MSAPSRPTHRFAWLHTVLAILVLTAQLVVAVAPLAESRDRRMASHVEHSGQQTHRAHNESTCAACQVRSIQGSTPRVATPLIGDVGPAALQMDATQRAVTSDTRSPSVARAPPAQTLI
jgi:cytochrome c-type biogenesis protein CcmH/NrfF